MSIKETVRKIIPGNLGVVVLMVFMLGCDGADPGIKGNSLKEVWSYHYNLDSPVLQKIGALAYVPEGNSTIIAWEPALPGQANIMMLPFSSNRDDLIRTLPVNPGRVSSSSISKIAVSSDGVFQAFAGRSRQLTLIKNNAFFKEANFSYQVSEIAFGEQNLLAAGDSAGNIFLFETGNLNLLRKIKLFAGPITSLNFSGSFLYAAGSGSKIYKIKGSTGIVEKTYEALDFSTGVMRSIGLTPCYEPKTHHALIVKPDGLLITTHGWEYCQDYKIRIWDEESGRLVKAVNIPKSRILGMKWIPEIRRLVFVDRDHNLWKMSLDDFSVSPPINAGAVVAALTFKDKDGSEAVISPNLGFINSMESIPGTADILLAAGSFFKGGPKVILANVGGSGLDIKAMLFFYSFGHVAMFVSEDL